MRRLRYQVACSLDGYIAGPGGEFDWIVADPEIDFGALFSEFDTLLMGRRTYEVVAADAPVDVVAELKAEAGKDIWLFGGGELFRSLLDAGCVDTVEPAVIPVLLGGGIPLLPPPAARRSLELTGHRVFRSGIVWLEYAVRYGSGV